MKLTSKITLNKGDSARGEVVEINSMKELSKLILSDKYSFGIFKDNILMKNNFISTRAIGLDFDKDYTLEQARTDFKSFQCIIATTKSHQKEKNGIVCDRFRVILFLTEEINDNETFYSTYIKLQNAFPKLDPQVKNSNRWFLPSKEIILINNKGKKVKPEKTIDSFLSKPQLEVLELKGKGKLLKKTRKLLKEGLTIGSRNGDTFKIAKDFQENGYTEDEAVKFITKAFSENNTLSYDFTQDEVENTIRSAYSSDPTLTPRKPFKLLPIKELYKKNITIEWVVDKLLSRGGVSLLSAVPKAGKSNIARQLISNILKKEKFFKRDTLYGEIHYYAIEEQPEIIQQSFRKFELPPNSPLYIHTGDVFASDKLDALYEVLKERKPVLAVIDTLFDVLDVQNENNYREVQSQIRKLRQIARTTNCHIMCVHHANKGFGTVSGSHRSVLGSQAIVGGVDTIILIEMDGVKRIITSMGRSVKPWTLRELIWNSEDESYSLGSKYEPEEY